MWGNVLADTLSHKPLIFYVVKIGVWILVRGAVVVRTLLADKLLISAPTINPIAEPTLGFCIQEQHTDVHLLQNMKSHYIIKLFSLEL